MFLHVKARPSSASANLHFISELVCSKDTAFLTNYHGIGSNQMSMYIGLRRVCHPCNVNVLIKTNAVENQLSIEFQTLFLLRRNDSNSLRRLQHAIPPP